MKRVYIIFGILLVACECFCNPILDKLTEIDNQMGNGKIEYVLKSDDIFLGTQRIVLSYLEDGIFKKVYYFEKGYHFTKYFDGNDVIGVTDGSHGSPSIALYSRSEVDKAYPFADVLSKASCVYGRGLSKLDLSNVSINNNILTGKYHSWLITAYLDPKYDYAFYKLEIKFENGKTVSTLINSNPILVDNKFYIFSKSSYRDVNKSLNRDITINSVTFVPPDKKDIEFDWKKSDLPIVDTRVNDLPVGYSRESLGSDITSEKLLKKSEKNVKEIYSDKNVKKSDNPRNKIIILCISLLLFVLVLSIFIHSIKKKEMKKYLIIIILLSVCNIIYADILADIENTDSQMKQGIISYEINGKTPTYDYNQNVKYYYDSVGRCMEETKEKDSLRKWYFDGKNYFDVEENIIVVRNKRSYDINEFSYSTIHNYPGLRYGRGLSKLDNIKINGDVVSGDLEGKYHIKAHIIPKYDNICDKAEIFRNDKLVAVIENSELMKADGFYIYAKSKRTIKEDFYNIITIKSASFKKPNEYEYIYNWKNLDSDLYDERFAPPLFYKRGELNITGPEDLLKISQERVNNYNKELDSAIKRYGNKPPASRHSVYVTALSVLIILLVLVMLIMKIKNNKSSHQ